MRIQTYKIADISTCHITKRDGELIRKKEAPFRIAETDEGTGTFFYVPTDYDESDMREELVAFDFSHEFIELMARLWVLGIPFVRFDADGSQVAEAPKFEW